MIRTLLISLLMLLQSLSVPEGDSLSGTFVRTGAQSDVEERESPSGTEAEGNDLNVAEIIFEHIGDAYEWHIASWGNRHLVLHLPVIVHSSTGWHVFSSKLLEHGAVYEGLKIDPEKG